MNFRPGLTAFVLILSLASHGWAQQKAPPLDEKGVLTILQLGFDDETIVERIKASGLSSTASDEFLAKLKAAGASDAVVQAVQAAGTARPGPAADGDAPPITYEQVLQMISLQLNEDKVLARIARTPPIFQFSAAQEEELVRAGATPRVIAALKGDRPPPVAASKITDLAIVLDCSGSMRELTKEGEMKMDAARRVVSDLVRKIPLELNVAFVIYGHEAYGGADDPRNCEAVKVVRPLAPLNEAGRTELLRAIAACKPTGATPIANAMAAAGKELAKNNAQCGMVVLTDGLESCKGNPAGEAAELLANLKLSFGVNVVGFGVKSEDDPELEAVARAGKGKYYNADTSAELTDRMSSLAKEIADVSKPPETVDTTRRALRVLQPAIDLPEMDSITLIEDKDADLAVKRPLGKLTQYGDYLRIPSGDKKYAIIWQPKSGLGVLLLRDFSIPERRVVDLKPESVLGMIQVEGTGSVSEIYVLKAGERGAVFTKVQHAQRYGEIMVVPAGKYDVYVDGSAIEQDLDVQPGKVQRLK